MNTIHKFEHIFVCNNFIQKGKLTNAKAATSRIRTAAPYSEYLSIFLATRTSLNKRAVLSKPINVVVY
jgi:hypothetical protein